MNCQACTTGSRASIRSRHARASSSGVGWRLHGKNTVLWGGYTWQYQRVTRSVKPAEYQFFGVGAGSRASRSAVTA